MTSVLELDVKGTIARPIEEVRSQFADIDYHAKGGVHKALTYKIIKNSPTECHYQQEVVILGMKQSDETVTRRLSNGNVFTEVINGTNKGFEILFTFAELPEKVCVVTAHFKIPVTGIKKWLGPLFKIAVRKTAEGALKEDQADLESGNYYRYSSKKV
jgi:hypothetical protein